MGDESLYDGNASWSIVDTGNPSVLLPDTGYETFNSVIDAELAGYGLDQVTITSSECPTGAPSGLCKVTCVLGLPHDHAEVDKRLPSFTVALQGYMNNTVMLNMTASRSYMLPYPGPNNTTMWCRKVVSVRSSLGNIGAPLLRSFVTVFDIANERLGFAPQQFDKCAIPVAPVAPAPPPGGPTPATRTPSPSVPARFLLGHGGLKLGNVTPLQRRFALNRCGQSAVSKQTHSTCQLARAPASRRAPIVGHRPELGRRGPAGAGGQPWQVRAARHF